RLLALTLLVGCSGGPAPLVVGSKPFPESELIGELVAQLAEADGARVDRKFYLGGQVCFEALKKGDVDVYGEYTGTGLVNILGEPPATDPEAVFARVKTEFASRWGLEWLPRLGFNNTYAMLVRPQDAAARGLKALSGLPKTNGLRCGFDLEFADRPDGYKGLAAALGGPFCAEVRQMAPDLMYDALARGDVDLISGYSTDGRIAALRLQVLADDKRFFPPYDAAPLAGPKAFAKAPKLRARLEALAGRLTDAKMTRLNAAVVAEKRQAKDVAREFLAAEGLLK
ncbi:MAG: periplasmic glycine betaine/choline-binding (lipo)protein of an ABC-type transport system (osmoprotectant binding protein), partial [Elusimicrobia bacterium]